MGRVGKRKGWEKGGYRRGSPSVNLKNSSTLAKGMGPAIQGEKKRSCRTGKNGNKIKGREGPNGC